MWGFNMIECAIVIVPGKKGWKRGFLPMATEFMYILISFQCMPEKKASGWWFGT